MRYTNNIEIPSIINNISNLQESIEQIITYTDIRKNFSNQIVLETIFKDYEGNKPDFIYDLLTNKLEKCVYTEKELHELLNQYHFFYINEERLINSPVLQVW